MPIFNADSASINSSVASGSVIIQTSLILTSSANNNQALQLTGSLLGNATFANILISASFITGSNVYGPFGSNSVISSSRSLTSSFSTNSDLSLNSYPLISRIYNDLGGQVKFETGFNSYGGAILNSTSTTAWSVSFPQRYHAVYIPTSASLTGVKWVQTTAGAYTYNNSYAGISLYSVSSSGNLILIASSSNNPSIYRTASAVRSESFVSTVNVAPGLYYLATHLPYTVGTVNPLVLAQVFTTSTTQLYTLDSNYVGLQLRPWYVITTGWTQAQPSSSISISSLNSLAVTNTLPMQSFGLY